MNSYYRFYFKLLHILSIACLASLIPMAPNSYANSAHNSVEVGILIHKIHNQATQSSKVSVDYELWFLSPVEFDVTSLDIPTADGQVDLQNPTYEEIVGDKRYQLFSLSSEFNLTLASDGFGAYTQKLEIKVAHKWQPAPSFSFTISGDPALIDPGLDLDGYSIAAPPRASIEAIERPTKGDPRLRQFGDMVPFDQFVVQVQLEDTAFLFERNITPAIIVFCLVGVLVYFITSEAYQKYRGRRLPKKLTLVPITLLIVSAILVSEHYLLGYIAGLDQSVTQSYVAPAVKAAWWLAAAFLSSLVLTYFLWSPLEEATGRTVPKIVKLGSTSIIYVLAFFGIVAFVFDQKLTSLLATSGLVAMIVGLALQVNLANVFSGIFINMERPFRTGDWVKIGDTPVGEVLDVSWRTTKVRRFNNAVMSVPNSLVAESVIENMTFPNKNYFVFLGLHFDPKLNPEKLTKLLYDALRVAKPVDGRPNLELNWVKCIGVDEGGLSFFCAFDITDRLLKNSQEHEVMLSIYRVLGEAGITPEPRRSNVHLYRGKPDPLTWAEHPGSIIDRSKAFAPLDDSTKSDLMNLAVKKAYAAGDTLQSAGVDHGRLALILTGSVSVLGDAHFGKGIEAGRLGGGDFFGERAFEDSSASEATYVAMTPVTTLEFDASSVTDIVGSGNLEIDDFKAAIRLVGYESSEFANALEKRDYLFMKTKLAAGVSSKVSSLFQSTLLGKLMGRLLNRNITKNTIEPIVAASALIAAADGSVSDVERDRVIEIFRNTNLMDHIKPKDLLREFNLNVDMLNDDAEKNRPLVLETVKRARSNKELSELIIGICHAIGAADGVVDPEEEEVLEEIAVVLGQQKIGSGAVGAA